MLSLDGGPKPLSLSADITESIEELNAYGGEEDESHSILSVDYKSLSSDSGEDLEKMAQLASLLKAGQYEKAITLLDHFEVSGGNNPNFGLVKAQIALMKDDLPLAREYARRTIKVAKDFVRGYKFLAYVYMLMEDWRRAKIVLLAALEQTEDDVEVYILASYAFQGDGEPREATRLLEKAVVVDPKSSVAFEKLGVALFAEGRVERSLKAYVQSVKLDKENARAYVGLGTVCFAKGWVRDAVTAYQTALERDPYNAEAMTNIGLLAFRSGQVAEGLELVYRGYMVKSESTTGWSNFMVALQQLFPLRQVDWSLVSLSGIAPLTEDQRHYQWGLYLSRQQGMQESAFRHLLQAAFLNQEHAEMINDTGAMLASFGWLHISKALFTKALELYPEYSEARENLDQVDANIARVESEKK